MQAKTIVKAVRFQKKPITHPMGWRRCVSSYPVSLKACEASVMGEGGKPKT